LSGGSSPHSSPLLGLTVKAPSLPHAAGRRLARAGHIAQSSLFPFHGLPATSCSKSRLPFLISRFSLELALPPPFCVCCFSISPRKLSAPSVHPISQAYCRGAFFNWKPPHLVVFFRSRPFSRTAAPFFFFPFIFYTSVSAGTFSFLSSIRRTVFVFKLSFYRVRLRHGWTFFPWTPIRAGVGRRNFFWIDVVFLRQFTLPPMFALHRSVETPFLRQPFCLPDRL